MPRFDPWRAMGAVPLHWPPAYAIVRNLYCLDGRTDWRCLTLLLPCNDPHRVFRNGDTPHVIVGLSHPRWPPHLEYALKESRRRVVQPRPDVPLRVWPVRGRPGRRMGPSGRCSLSGVGGRCGPGGSSRGHFHTMLF